jgi:uncharacterized glyoxalase superfamily protein PhnB
MSIRENKELVRRYFEDAPYNPGACEDQFWGERLFRLRDLNGNQLVITQSIENVDLATKNLNKLRGPRSRQ